MSVILNSPLYGREGAVKLNDGRTLAGDVEEANGNVNVTIHGIKTVLSRADVKSIDYDVDAETEFKDRLAKLEGDDATGRIELARWAFEKEEYTLAKTAVDEALKIDPNNADAVTMRATVQSQMRLKKLKAGATTRAGESATRSSTTPSTQPATAADATQPATTTAARPVLTPDDINTIRQAELQADDVQVRLQFANDVKKRFATQQNMTVPQLNAFAPLAQAMKILEQGDDAMKKDVRILSDPQSLFEFRRNVQPGVIAGCGTTGCHGGGSGVGGLRILNPADNDAAVYTNFYLIQSYRKQRPGGNAVFGGGDLRLIDRTHPEDSLLLSYGLPVNVAKYDHPKVQAWKPSFRGMQDANYGRLSEWITSSLTPTEPEYGITFEGGPTTRPVDNPGESTPGREPSLDQPAPVE
ncbi:MAG: hypothetical protein H0T11_04950 [Chthoniobacterales bacterium]|nr:hypothetical protein [Chthoniobacterales bacterium]